MKLSYGKNLKTISIDKNSRLSVWESNTNRVSTLWGGILVGYSTAVFKKKLIFL
jgi:hypothetical protein